MLTRILFILPLILLFISCTVTKRVHRPGYHVQWHKIQRTETPELAKQTVQIASETINPPKEKLPPSSQSSILDDVAPVEIEKRESPEASEIIVGKMEKNLDFKRFNPFPKDLQVESTKTTRNQQNAKERTTNRPIFWRMSAKNLKFLGVFLMCFGGLLLVGSLLTYLGAFSGNGAGAGAWASFFIDLITISEWFWLLFFILAIALVMYLAVLLVRYVFGGPLIAAIVGLSLVVIGIFFYALGERRDIES